MAQGLVKQTVTAPKKAKNPGPGKSGPGKGTRIIKPKKAALIKQDKLRKKHSAGMTAVTEKMLAERAGHLEMLKGGKKERDDKKKAAGIVKK